LKDQLFKDSSAITRSADELQVEYTTGSIVARIWREHLKPRIGLLLLATFAMLLTAATTGAIPFLIQRTADDVFVGKNAQMVYLITAAIVVVTVIKAIAEYVADVTVAYLGNRFIADLRIQMFAKLARADLSWIQTVHSGRLLSSFLTDALLIRQTASRSPTFSWASSTATRPCLPLGSTDRNARRSLISGSPGGRGGMPGIVATGSRGDRDLRVRDPRRSPGIPDREVDQGDRQTRPASDSHCWATSSGFCRSTETSALSLTRSSVVSLAISWFSGSATSG